MADGFRANRIFLSDNNTNMQNKNINIHYNHGYRTHVYRGVTGKRKYAFLCSRRF